MRGKWVHRCSHNLKPIESQRFRLCQPHFSIDCFRLFVKSMPTKMLFHCLVTGCVKDTDAPFGFHKLSKVPVELDPWAKNVLIPYSDLLRDDIRVCHRNFEIY